MTTQTGERKIPVNFEGAQLLQDAFKNNDDLLITTRALLFGYTLTPEETELIRTTYKNEALREEVRRKVYQELVKDAPIGANPDYWVGTEQEVLGHSPETVNQILEAKDKCLEMFKKAFKLLEDPTGEKISIEYHGTKDDVMGINMIARNLFIKGIETGLSYCKIIAEQDLEKMKKEAIQNSTK